MRLLLANPNATRRMTDAAVAVARATMPEAEIVGWTNADGPPAIQGPEDGEAAARGLRALPPDAWGADATIVACFDDTGLAALRARLSGPVLGIGQSAMHLAALLGHRFGVVTTLPVSVPVIEANLLAYGLGGACTGVRPSGLPVLEVERGGPDVIGRLAAEIAAAAREDGAGAVVLGCAGMAPLRPALQALSPVPLVDGVEAACLLAPALVGAGRLAGAGAP